MNGFLGLVNQIEQGEIQKTIYICIPDLTVIIKEVRMKSQDFSEEFHKSEHKAWKYTGYIHHTINNPPEPKVYVVFDGKYMNVARVTVEQGNVIIHLLEE